MSNMILLISTGAAALAAAATTFGWCRIREATRKARAALQIDQLQRQLGQANELLVQARRQAAALQQQFDQARRDHGLPQQLTLLQIHNPKPVDESIVVDGTGYADTLIQLPPEQRKAA
jgi:uncharacterized protein HemX